MMKTKTLNKKKHEDAKGLFKIKSHGMGY